MPSASCPSAHTALAGTHPLPPWRTGAGVGADSMGATTHPSLQRDLGSPARETEQVLSNPESPRPSSHQLCGGGWSFTKGLIPALRPPLPRGQQHAVRLHTHAHHPTHSSLPHAPIFRVWKMRPTSRLFFSRKRGCCSSGARFIFRCVSSTSNSCRNIWRNMTS